MDYGHRIEDVQERVRQARGAGLLEFHVPAVTADAAWLDIDAGVPVEVIR